MPKKRVTGVKVYNGQVIIIEEISYQCVCIKDKGYIEPTSTGSSFYSPTISSQPKEYKKGTKYEYTIDSDSFVSNPYSVYIFNESNYFTKEEFDEYFIDIVDNRNNIIDEITK